MVVLVILVNIIILIVSLIAWASYERKRSASKEAFIGSRSESRPIRFLTEEELVYIKEHYPRSRFNKNKPYFDIKVPIVHYLVGGYGWHSFGNSGNQVKHHLINGVEVVIPEKLLPYANASEVCIAEVVYTETLAVVVSVNGVHALYEQGSMVPVSHDDADTAGGESAQAFGEASDQEIPETEGRLPFVFQFGNGFKFMPVEEPLQVISTRDERGDEAAALFGIRRNYLFFMSLCISFFVFIIVMTFIHAENAVVLTALTALSLAFMVYTLLRKGKVKRDGLGKVQKFEGQVSWQKGLVGNDVIFVPVIGQAMTLFMPTHWSKALHERMQAGDRIAVEVTDNFEHSVVGIGEKWRIADEPYPFPFLRLRNALIILSVGVLMCLIYFLVYSRSAGIGSDFERLSASPIDPTVKNYQSARAYLKDPLVGRSFVSLSGGGQCEMVQGREQNQIDLSCQRVRWEGDPVSLPDIEVPEKLKRLFEGRFIHLSTERQRGLGHYSPSGYYSPSYDYTYTVGNLDESLIYVDDVCQSMSMDCSDLKNKLLILVNQYAPLEQDTLLELDGWDALMHVARDGGLKEAFTIKDKQQVNKIEDLGQLTAFQVVKALNPRLSEMLIEAQTGGVLIELPIEKRASLFEKMSSNDELPIIDLIQMGQKERSRDFPSLYTGVWLEDGVAAPMGNDAKGTPIISFTYDYPTREDFISSLRKVFYFFTTLVVIFIGMALTVLRSRSLKKYHERHTKRVAELPVPSIF